MDHVYLQPMTTTTKKVESGKILFFNLLIHVFIDNLNFCYSCCRASAYMCQPMFGRHGAHKHHDTMGEVSNYMIISAWNLKQLHVY